MNCWSCQAPLGTGTDLCSRCGKLQPPRARDYFDYLGLPRAWHVDAEKLSDVLHEKSRRLHPDRFAKADPKERTYSLQHTTMLNDAVRTLRDPQRRAEYLLGLYGLKAGANDRERVQMDPSFLMEMMETREALAEAKAKKDQPTLAKLGESAKAQKERLLSAAEAKFSQWEKAPDDKAPLEQVVPLLDQVRYFEQIVAEASGQPVVH